MLVKRKATDEICDVIEWLASFGKTAGGGVTRLLYTPAWKEAQHALKKKMEETGLHAYFDSVGNLFGRLEGTEAGETILTGSHIDTVIEGGKYDGAYGIAASFIAVSRLLRQYGAPKKTIEVVSLCEEEGSRFPLSFWGSKNIRGTFSLDDVKDVKDSHGIPFLHAMQASGFSPENDSPAARDDVHRFIEMHIEQGMVLEKNQNAVGIVTHIVGQRRYTIRIEGESNHAGTTPMPFRKDAVSAAAEFISYLTRKAKELDPLLVATVGRMEVKPNVPNVVAGEIEFSLDIRHHKTEVIDQFCSDIFTALEKQSEAMQMKFSVSQWMDEAPVELDTEMAECARSIAQKQNIRFQDMVSGAGHDAQVFGPFCPTLLLFVPSRSGISHSPKEYTAAQDLETGVALLEEVLYKIAY
ncbi:allantoate deiminase [Heyndrickxia coagulans]|uniref:allantoate deiminase n=1 Tax=Heyndrickxia coagulans TaxID=1398 RepID=UPI002E22043C|nr:allantoate deiminase [Heyndrickxia coagulans]MED4963103.1 allantoate deiminase [Heyndrickxia coagulans]